MHQLKPSSALLQLHKISAFIIPASPFISSNKRIYRIEGHGAALWGLSQISAFYYYLYCQYQYHSPAAER